jgi:hypothetical protein
MVPLYHSKLSWLQGARGSRQNSRALWCLALPVFLRQNCMRATSLSCSPGLMRCVQHGVRVHSQKTPGENGKIWFNWTDRPTRISSPGTTGYKSGMTKTTLLIPVARELPVMLAHSDSATATKTTAVCLLHNCSSCKDKRVPTDNGVRPSVHTYNFLNQIAPSTGCPKGYVHFITL